METAKKERFGIVLPIVIISYFMILLDNTVVFTSTVKISQDLNMNAQTLAWISNAYILTFGGLQLLGGRLGDLMGRKRIFLVGIAIFTVASLLVGLSTSAAMIIAMRTIQGIGAAIIAPTTLALLMDNYKGKMLTRSIAYYGTTAGLGFSLGLMIGGLIASLASWRFGFLMNVPVGIAVFLLTCRYIKERGDLKRQKLDILGTLFSVLGLTGIIYGINGSVYKIPAMIIGIIFLALFVRQERRAPVPIMPLKLFSSPIRVGAYLSRFFLISMSFTFLFLAPQAMQNLYGYTPFQAAVMFLFMSIPQFIAASQVTRLNAKWTNAKIAGVGIFVSVVATLWIVLVGVESGFWLAMAVPMILLGVGQGFAISPLTTLGVADTTPDIAGSASGVVNTSHQTGQTTGLALTVALTSGITSYATAFNTAMGIVTIYAVIALIAITRVARIMQHRAAEKSIA